MNLLLINHNALSSNSGIHVANLARELVALGMEVAIAVPEAADLPATVAPSPFATLTWEAADQFRFSDGLGADLVHVWTPRQHVAATARRLAAAHHCKYVVHLEDNEHAITAAFLGLGVSKLLARSRSGLAPPIPALLAEPGDMRQLLEGAAGVSVLVDRLLEFKPAHVPGVEISPAAEDDVFYPRPADASLRASLGLGEHTKVIVYHGNAHPANVDEIRSLYLAVGALARGGALDIKLLRLGVDHAEIVPEALSELEQYVIKVPFQPREQLPLYLALADVLVQPGRIDDFNAYRFPSKLPEFLAMGRPVILPATNVGLRVVDGEEGLLLHHGDALEIARAVHRVLTEPELAARLAAGARRFYERELGWQKSAALLHQLYERIGSKGLDDMQNNDALQRVAKHYLEWPKPPALGYATVRDYSESIDHLKALSTINHDLKDAQRPWIFKTILSTVPRGGRLLEIGAGDPWVADLLTRLGYEVVIVDPYDGTARGPDQFEAIKAQFPNITFVRGFFPQALGQLQDGKFDCIYSISVLEHLPTDAVAPVFEGIARHSRTPQSPTIHAIDHVLLGDGAESHLALLEQMIDGLGLKRDALHAMLARLDRDPDAYFLSAESHNLWRGATPYDQFPMRRCVSVQICSPASVEQLGLRQ